MDWFDFSSRTRLLGTVTKAYVKFRVVSRRFIVTGEATGQCSPGDSVANFYR